MDCLSSTLRFGLVATATMLCCTGCLLAPSQRATDAAVEGHYFPEKNEPKEQSPTRANAQSPAPADLSAAMAEVHQLGQSDPAAQQALVDDLRRTDPALWPQLVNAYRTSLAYKHQSSERLARLAQNNVPLVGESNPAVAAMSPQTQMPPGGGYPTTSTPTAHVGPDLTSYSMQPEAQSMPMLGDGAILNDSAPTGPPNNYPTTNYPEVRLAAAESYSIQNSESPRYKLTTEDISPDDWQSQFATAIRAMEAKVAAGTNSSPSATDQAMLRLMYLAAGRREDALLPLNGVSLAEQEFWSKELAGLVNLLDQRDDRDQPQRIAEAARQLQQAVTRLNQLSPLAIHNLAFCTEVNSFGVYKPTPAQSFKPGQQLLLYAEIDNFVSEETEKGHRTSLGSRYEILDSQRNRVAGEDFGQTDELCRNARRDFFVRYFLKLPKSLKAGQYTLQLMIEDTIAVKAGRGQISFSVVE